MHGHVQAVAPRFDRGACSARTEVGPFAVVPHIVPAKTTVRFAITGGSFVAYEAEKNMAGRTWRLFV